MAADTKKEFVFTFTSNNQKSTLRAPIRIPLDQSTSEYAERLIEAHKLPCFVEKALYDELNQFVETETRRLHDQLADNAIEKLHDKRDNAEHLINLWSQAFTKEVLEHAETEPLSNEVVFSEVYHSLIHSPALETLLNLECTYSLSVGNVLQQRDRDLNHLETRQRGEMEEAIQGLGVTYTDEQINQMAQRHFENTQLIESKWASELSNQQETQKREYREWVMTQAADTDALHRVNLSRQSGQSWTGEDVESPARREESFTVHLGAQLKTMHNLRIISCDILDFCMHSPASGSGLQPERLQTAMSLYSSNLCGLVLHVDNRLNTYTGVKREFARVCEQSTDFHFPNLEQQFEGIEVAVGDGNEWRQQHVTRVDDADRTSVGGGSISSDSTSDKEERSLRMQTGDFYITRHSNLAQTHTVFHLVTDDSVRSIQSDISSRHAVILGYRNILKACYRYNITSLTLPLLLVHDMSEEMTINWCMKRAELVFKCVKGFMMEFATWSGQQSRTIQFVVPQGLSEETFASISHLLPSIFRMSNPVTAKS